MNHTDVSLIVSTLCGLAPAVTALLLAIAAYITSHNNSSNIVKNTERLDHLENGGGDAKIDARLAKIGLVERRDAEGVPTPVSLPASAPVTAQEATSGV